MPIAHISTPLATTEYTDPISFDLFKDVVLKKQELYNEGRSLVQQKLDNTSQIEGMLGNQADKEYFRQEMKKYTDAINKNAGVDFSQKANVQAVLSIGRPLENDQILLTAINSAQNKKKMMDERQKLDPKLISPANDALFFDPIVAYTQSKTPGTALAYNPYQPYSNEVVEMLPKIIDKLKPNISETYEMDKSGRYLIKRKYTELDAVRIKEALTGSLSPAGQKQLAIDAQYALKTAGKGTFIPEYVSYLNKTVESSASRVADAESSYKEAVKTFGQNDPRTQQAFNNLNKYQIAHESYIKKASRTPEQISDGELVNFITDQNLSDAAGPYAYKQAENDMDADKYSLASFNSDLRKGEKLFDAQVDASSKPASEGPPPPGHFKGDAGFEAKTHGIQEFTDLYGALSPEKQKALVSGMLRFVGGAEPTYDNKGNVTGAKEGKTTVYEALRKWNGVNGWDATDKSIVAQALGGPQKFKSIEYKLKGLYKNLTDAVSPIAYKETATGPVSMNFSPKSNNIYVRDMDNNVAEMTVQEFLSQPAAVLVKVKDIRIAKPFEGDYQVK
jgi:hypothetical protein